MFMSWIVYLSNEIVDPYYGWQLDYNTFINFLNNKYGSSASAQQKILNWRVNWDDDPSVISVSDYQVLPDKLKKYWNPLYNANYTINSYDRAQLNLSSTTNIYYQINYDNSVANVTFNVGDFIAVTISNNVITTGEVFSISNNDLVIQHIIGTPVSLVSYVTTDSSIVLLNGESVAISNNTVNTTMGVYLQTANTLLLAYDGNTTVNGHCTITGLESSLTLYTDGSTPIYSQINDVTNSNNIQLVSSNVLVYSIPQSESIYWSPYFAYDYEDEKNTAKQNIKLLADSLSLQATIDLKSQMGSN